MGKLRVLALALLVTAPLATIAAANHTGQSGQYVVGLYARVGIVSVQAGLCQDPSTPSPIGIAEVCYLTAPDPADLTITVEDTFQGGPVLFRYIGFTSPNPPNEPNPLPCGADGEAVSVVHLSLIPECTHILVRPGLGSLMGTVTLS